MAANPEPVQISMKSAQATEAVSTIPCAICRRQFSRYTCPQCNIPYCSLTCFRSESHNNCSEVFYRKEIESDVRSESSKTAEERHKMLELLKHFEEGAMDDDILESDPADDDDDAADMDLARRIGGLDIDSASYDELWGALTPEERDEFLKALGDPKSDLAQQLLASEELERARIEPWWESHAQLDAAGELIPQPASSIKDKRFGVKPNIMAISASMVEMTPVAGKRPLLLYNLCAICIVYSYLTRYFATSPLSTLSPEDSDHEEAGTVVTQLIPFLTDRKSKAIHSNLSSVVTDLWSRFEPDNMTRPFFSILLHDAARLLQPSAVTEISPTSSPSGESPDLRQDQAYSDLENHPSANALRVLSDLSKFFSDTSRSPPSNSSKPGPTSNASSTKTNHITHKLMFYAAHVLGVPVILLRALCDELDARAETIIQEDITINSRDVSGTSQAVHSPPEQARINHERIKELN